MNFETRILLPPQFESFAAKTAALAKPFAPVKIGKQLTFAKARQANLAALRDGLGNPTGRCLAANRQGEVSQILFHACVDRPHGIGVTKQNECNLEIELASNSDFIESPTVLFQLSPQNPSDVHDGR